MKALKAFIEGYGCSLNKSDTEKIRGFLKSNGFSIVASPEKANLLIINTCAVKEQTENKMIKRIRHLFVNYPKKQIVVFGCLPRISPEKISKISPSIVQIGPLLEELCNFLSLPLTKFSPSVSGLRLNEFISIMPICRGCLGECAFCCVRQARGKLKSYSVEELCSAFKKAVSETKEIWITAQDSGCYGKDIGSSLPELISALLKNKGEFRIRVGMLNPQHLSDFFDSYLSLFTDKRLYRFFHIPLQSGSNKILKRMKRKYSAEEFLDLVSRIKERVPDATIATDVIVGFPGETEQDFQETVEVLKKAKPDVVNISRYGDRPNTLALKMNGKLHGRLLKKRSRILTELCKKISLENNKAFEGMEMEIFVSERGEKGNFVGRTSSYKPVVIEEDLRGKFARVRIEKVFPTYLKARVLS